MMLLVLSSEKCIDIRFFKEIFYFLLCWVFIAARALLLLHCLVVSGGCCLAVVHRFLTAAASLVAELGSRV